MASLNTNQTHDACMAKLFASTSVTSSSVMKREIDSHGQEPDSRM